MKIFQGQGQGQDFFLKAKAKDMKIVQGQHQGQLSQLPLRAKIFIAVTEIYAYLIKHNAKELICGDFDVQC